MAITYLQLATDGTNGTSFTFASQNFGTADADRYIVVGINGRSNDGTDKTLNSVTIGGVTATISVSAWNSGNVAAIAVAAVPTGTSGSVVIAFSDTMTSCALSMWSELKLSSLTATDTGTDTTDPLSTNITLTNGFIVAVAKSDSVGDSATWTNVDENFDTTDADSNFITGASKSYTTQQTNLAVTADWVSGATRTVFACAAFEINPNASPTIAVLSAVATVQEPTVTGGALVSPSVVTATAAVVDPTVTTALPDWTNIDKNSSSWTNQDKS